MARDIFKNLEIGSTFVNHGYVSTSLSFARFENELWESDLIVLKIKIPEGSHFLAGVSPQETEYLFPHKSEFVIKNKIEAKTIYLTKQNEGCKPFTNEEIANFNTQQMKDFASTLATMKNLYYELDYREPQDLFPLQE